jgi:hypothetical protein
MSPIFKTLMLGLGILLVAPVAQAKELIGQTFGGGVLSMLCRSQVTASGFRVEIDGATGAVNQLTRLKVSDVPPNTTLLWSVPAGRRALTPAASPVELILDGELPQKAQIRARSAGVYDFEVQATRLVNGQRQVIARTSGCVSVSATVAAPEPNPAAARALVNPAGLAIAPNGRVFVGEFCSPSGSNGGSNCNNQAQIQSWPSVAAYQANPNARQEITRSSAGANAWIPRGIEGLAATNDWLFVAETEGCNGEGVAVAPGTACNTGVRGKLHAFKWQEAGGQAVATYSHKIEHADFRQVRGLAVDNAGMLYLANDGTNNVLKIDARSAASMPVSVNLSVGHSSLKAVAVQPGSGNLYTVDLFAKKVRGFSGSGAALAGKEWNLPNAFGPIDLAFDNTGRFLYVSEVGGGAAVRKIDTQNSGNPVNNVATGVLSTAQWGIGLNPASDKLMVLDSLNDRAVVVNNP